MSFQQVFPQGFSANFVLIIWALFGSLFVYFFLANFRTMLLMPKYGKPIDSAQDILDRGLIPFRESGGGYWKQFLLQSPNPAYQELGEILVIAKDWDHYYKMMEEDILVANTHVMLGFLDGYDRTLGKFHESKDTISGAGKGSVDILNKKWSLGEEYSYHLLLFHQVILVECN